MLTELDVVNGCLATIGELPLVELNDDHPLIAAARGSFKMARVAEVSRQWWFNTDFLVLEQANDSFVYAPSDALAVNPLTRRELTLRGRRLYNRMGGTYIVEGPVSCWVIRDLDFADLPSPAQLLVHHSAVLHFQINYDADESKTLKLEKIKYDAHLTLNAEHIRQVRLNNLELPEVAYKRMAAGIGRRHNHIRVR